MWGLPQFSDLTCASAVPPCCAGELAESKLFRFMGAQRDCHSWSGSVFTLSHNQHWTQSAKSCFQAVVSLVWEGLLAFRKKKKETKADHCGFLSEFLNSYLLSYLTVFSAPAVISCPSGHGFNFF